MNASYEWLKELVPFDLTPAELRDLLTARVATVEELVTLREDLKDVVVGRVVEAERHPNADRLWVTKVDAGRDELIDVVCGAPVVKAGALYPYAPAGSTLPGGLKLEKRKIRGAVSNGMLCSARELALGDEHGGILELTTDATPGTPLLEAIPLGDTRLVIDVLPNRPDLLSHLGVAREIAAAVGKSAAPRAVEDAPAVPAARRGEREARAGRFTVRVEDAERSPRYMGVLLSGVKVGASPEWLARRLEAVGSRSINNVVDVTNYLLHELGQPMHAFDAAKLAGDAVVVRRARAGETLVTLDGQTRALDGDMLVIADAERAVALAGVMGGRDSEVGEGTTEVFLEVANFEPASTRSMRRRLGMSTDASYRFERGVDVDLPPVALARAVQLLAAVAGARVEDVPADVHAAPRERRAITLRADRVKRVLGELLADGEIARHLRAIGCDAEIVPGTAMLHGSEELFVRPPTWRADLVKEVDLIEEVARLYGYDTLPNELRPFRVGTVPDASGHVVAGKLRDALVAEGLFEARPLPFVKGGEGHVRIANPIAENEGYLRRDVLDSLARRVEYNFAHMQRNVRLFEIGSAFLPGKGPLPREELRVAAAVTGERRPPHFTEPRPPVYDEWDAKALGERITAVAFPGRRIAIRPGGEGALWTIEVDGTDRGRIARLSLDAPVWAAPAYGVELRLEVLSAAQLAPPGTSAHAKASGAAPSRAGVQRYRPLPTAPAVERDVALLVPDGVSAEAVERAVRASAGDLLESLVLFDEFRGAGVPAGHRSLAWRLTFRHPERTLRDKEVDGRREKLLRTLETDLGVRQRTS